MDGQESADVDAAYGRHFTVDRPGCQIHCWLTGPDGAPPAQVNDVIRPFLQRSLPG